MKKNKMFFKLIAWMLIQAFLIFDCAWAGGFKSLTQEQNTQLSALAPHLTISNSNIQFVFSQSIAQIPSKGSMTKGRILIVDDEDLLRNLLKEVLLELGYEVETAASVDEALGLYGRGFYDIIVTDYHLDKGKTAKDIVDEVKKTNPAQPIVLMSGAASKSEQESIAATVFFQKPIRIAEFEDALNGIIKFRKTQNIQSKPAKDNNILSFQFQDMIRKTVPGKSKEPLSEEAYQILFDFKLGNVDRKEAVKKLINLGIDYGLAGAYLTQVSGIYLALAGSNAATEEKLIQELLNYFKDKDEGSLIRDAILEVFATAKDQNDAELIILTEAFKAIPELKASIFSYLLQSLNHPSSYIQYLAILALGAIANRNDLVIQTRLIANAEKTWAKAVLIWLFAKDDELGRKKLTQAFKSNPDQEVRNAAKGLIDRLKDKDNKKILDTLRQKLKEYYSESTYEDAKKILRQISVSDTGEIIRKLTLLIRRFQASGSSSILVTEALRDAIKNYIQEKSKSELTPKKFTMASPKSDKPKTKGRKIKNIFNNEVDQHLIALDESIRNLEQEYSKLMETKSDKKTWANLVKEEKGKIERYVTDLEKSLSEYSERKDFKDARENLRQVDYEAYYLYQVIWEKDELVELAKCASNADYEKIIQKIRMSFEALIAKLKISRLKEELRQIKYGEKRIKVIEELGDIGTKEAGEILINALWHETERYICPHIARALQKCESPKANLLGNLFLGNISASFLLVKEHSLLDDLLQAIKHPRWQIREAVGRVLAEIASSPGMEQELGGSVEFLLQELRKDERSYAYIIESIKSALAETAKRITKLGIRIFLAASFISLSNTNGFSLDKLGTLFKTDTPWWVWALGGIFVVALFGVLYAFARHFDEWGYLGVSVDKEPSESSKKFQRLKKSVNILTEKLGAGFSGFIFNYKYNRQRKRLTDDSLKQFVIDEYLAKILERLSQLEGRYYYHELARYGERFIIPSVENFRERILNLLKSCNSYEEFIQQSTFLMEFLEKLRTQVSDLGKIKIKKDQDRVAENIEIRLDLMNILESGKPFLEDKGDFEVQVLFEYGYTDFEGKETEKARKVNVYLPNLTLIKNNMDFKKTSVKKEGLKQIGLSLAMLELLCLVIKLIGLEATNWKEYEIQLTENMPKFVGFKRRFLKLGHLVNFLEELREEIKKPRNGRKIVAFRLPDGRLQFSKINAIYYMPDSSSPEPPEESKEKPKATKQLLEKYIANQTTENLNKETSSIKSENNVDLSSLFRQEQEALVRLKALKEELIGCNKQLENKEIDIKAWKDLTKAAINKIYLTADYLRFDFPLERAFYPNSRSLYEVWKWAGFIEDISSKPKDRFPLRALGLIDKDYETIVNKIISNINDFTREVRFRLNTLEKELNRFQASEISKQKIISSFASKNQEDSEELIEQAI